MIYPFPALLILRKAKYKKERIMSEKIEQLLKDRQQLVIKQEKEWAEIIINWETSNKYSIFDSQKQKIGFIAERGSGFIKVIQKQFLRSHRPLNIDIIDKDSTVMMLLTRPFFWFFSDLTVSSNDSTNRNKILGHIKRRFGILYKKYDLLDEHGALFGTIKSPIWRLWTFPIKDRMEVERATISKKWGGVLREMFTDADTYLIDYKDCSAWTLSQKSIILAAAISIDFDFFEENQSRN